ncbi:MAG: archaemetzincin family Zn-dependent metalloprotease [candidate division WOR-3 bacterium]|nr:archaemetzincin family Zn-dependent metalloprotease [candidate division WOR-3 bacterium]
MAIDTIILVPFLLIENNLLNYLQRELNKTFQLPIIIEKPIPLPKSGYSEKRKQYDGNYFINELKKKEYKDKLVLGICDVDLYVPHLNFIFGLASPLQGIAIISLTRLREEFYNKPKKESLFFIRSLKEAIHEIGHLFNLEHCKNQKCVMFFSNSLLDTDRKGPNFCSACLKKLKGR